MSDVTKTLEELVESRTYLLDAQKKRLLEDFEIVEGDEEHLETIMDSVLFRLFNIHWSDLTAIERMDISIAWKEN